MKYTLLNDWLLTNITENQSLSWRLACCAWTEVSTSNRQWLMFCYTSRFCVCTYVKFDWHGIAIFLEKEKACKHAQFKKKQQLCYIIKPLWWDISITPLGMKVNNTEFWRGKYGYSLSLNSVWFSELSIQKCLFAKKKQNICIKW